MVYIWYIYIYGKYTLHKNELKCALNQMVALMFVYNIGTVGGTNNISEMYKCS